MAASSFHTLVAAPFLIQILLTLHLLTCPAAARPAVSSIPSAATSLPPLASRLKVDQSSTTTTNCWESLIELQSCTGEIILFFLNGETYLGHGCCTAIRVIGEHCWPNLIETVGFTGEESDVLEGYCDLADYEDDDGHEGHAPPPPAIVAISPAAVHAPNKAN
ncbi:Egg cell-secreted protein 1.1 [Linum grandiflorum]